MKALQCTEPGWFDYINIPEPVLQQGHAIIKIKRIGICGTDLHAFEGTQPFFNYPRILGHELAAEIVAIDGDTNFSVGEAVTFLPYFSCKTCIACRNGKPNCCTNIKVCGVHIDGGMAELFSVPVDTLIKNEGLSLDELALIEPLAIGAHGVRRAAIQKDEFALVIGAGPIGLGTMQMAKIAGAKVIAMDISDNRLNFCKNNIAVDYIINPATEDAVAKLKEITHGDMPTAMFDATGNQKAINNALAYLAHGGRYVLIGLQQKELIFSHPEFHKRETTLMSSRNATKEDFEHVVWAIKNKLVNPKDYITHRVKFNEVKDVFSTWLDPANGVIKAMVEMD